MQSNYKLLHDEYEKLKLMYLHLWSREERSGNMHSGECLLSSLEELRVDIAKPQSLDETAWNFECSAQSMNVTESSNTNCRC